MPTVRDREATAGAAERSDHRWRCSINAAAEREAHRARVRARMSALSLRIRQGRCIDRAADVRKLDDLWREVASWT